MSEFLQLLVKGAALGSVYALVALGFVVVFKATGVINFAQGSFLLLGAYLTFAAAVSWGLPFAVAVIVAAAGAVVLALAVERLVVRPLAGQPAVAVVLATLGVAVVVDQLVTLVWGFRPRHVGDPWGAGSVRIGGVALAEVDVATLVVAATVIAALAVFFRRTRTGLALRAAASDLEAAAAIGVLPASVSRLAWVLAAGVATVAGVVAATVIAALAVFFRRTRTGLALRAAASDLEAAAAIGVLPASVSRLAWVLAAGVATVAGVLVAAGPGAASPSLGEIALRAFPAVLLGGFLSLGGALAGGLVIGVVEVLTAGYLPGQELVVPYLVMLGVVLVRPDGLFGAREARRL